MALSVFHLSLSVAAVVIAAGQLWLMLRQKQPPSRRRRGTRGRRTR
jgi:hypothetical protein